MVGEVLGVAAPTSPSGPLLGCLVGGVLSSSTTIVSHVVTTDVAAPEYDNDEGGSFGFETLILTRSWKAISSEVFN